MIAATEKRREKDSRPGSHSWQLLVAARVPLRPHSPVGRCPAARRASARDRPRALVRGLHHVRDQVGQAPLLAAEGSVLASCSPRSLTPICARRFSQPRTIVDLLLNRLEQFQFGDRARFIWLLVALPLPLAPPPSAIRPWAPRSAWRLILELNDPIETRCSRPAPSRHRRRDVSSRSAARVMSPPPARARIGTPRCRPGIWPALSFIAQPAAARHVANAGRFGPREMAAVGLPR